MGQDKNATKFAKSITPQDLKTHLSYLASDELEGRETGMKGQKLAATYISNYFKSLGLEGPVRGSDNPYLQYFDLKRAIYNEVYLKKEGERKENFQDFLYYTKGETFGEEFIEVVFSGTGDLSKISKSNLEGRYVAFVNEQFINFRTTLAELKEAKAKGFILIFENDLEYEYIMDRYSSYLSGSKMNFEFDQSGSKIIMAGKELTEWLFDTPYGELKENGIGKTCEVIFNADLHINNVNSSNVLGFLEGSEKPEEVLVITAHYDHEGIKNGKIYNGADDDASGTSTVMELAEAFSLAAKKGFKPKRSILFMTVSGEEKGLLGSKYYTQNPVFPLKNTVTDLNIDMIGRVDNKHAGNPDYIYLIGSDKLSSELHELSEKVNECYTQLELDYTYNADDDPNRYYYRSDHYNFAKNGIPVIFYFNGTHEDYHRPTDTAEKIDYIKMKKIADLIFFTAWELANKEERVKLN